MARVRDVPIDEVPADARPVYQRFADEYGPFLNQVKIFAHRPIFPARPLASPAEALRILRLPRRHQKTPRYSDLVIMRRR